MEMKYCIALLLLTSFALGQESSALSLTTHIPLPNVKGRIDHASVDLKGQRLFVAAVANNTLEVIDLKSKVSNYNGGENLAKYDFSAIGGYNSNSFTYTLLNDVGLSGLLGSFGSVGFAPGWGSLVPGLQ